MGSLLSSDRVLESSDASEKARKGVISYDWNLNKTKVDLGEVASIDIVSWNILAPCYRRLEANSELGIRLREGHDKKAWLKRATDTLSFLENMFNSYKTEGGPEIVALQEFWMKDEYKDMFFLLFQKYGYECRTCKRPGSKMDSVCILVKKEEYTIEDQKDVRLLGGDRVALLLKVKHKRSGRICYIANTHLSFPHCTLDRRTQQKQMEALIAMISDFSGSKGSKENKSKNKDEKKNGQETKQGEGEGEGKKLFSVVLGDFNVEQNSSVCQMLSHAGFVSCLQVCSPHSSMQTDSTAHAKYIIDGQMLPLPTGTPGTNKTPMRSPSVSGSPSPGSVASTNSNETELELWDTSNGLDYRSDEQQEQGSTSTSAPVSLTRFVSHKTHNNEDLGVDHIYIKGSSGCRVFVELGLVLPTTLGCDVWPKQFTMSDHRPVATRIVVETSSLSRLGEES